jgi:hypothetical protein
MRNILILGLLSIGMATLAAAGQRGTAAPAAPPPAMHAMPAAQAPGAHAVPMHPASAAHPGTHPVTPGMTPVLSHKNHNGHNQGSNNGNTARTIRNNYCSNQALSSGYPVPGAGFDYEHFFAVHPGYNICNQGSNGVIPYLGGGYYPIPYTSQSPSQEAEQENTSNQQPDSNRLTYAQDSAASASSRSSSNTYSPTEPVAEFVFVKRDGSTFYAVAYILLKDKVQYVTKEGLRRSVALDSLDLDATQKFNEERGNTVNLPNLSHPA